MDYKYNGNNQLLSLIISASLSFIFIPVFYFPSFLPLLLYNERGAGEGRKEKEGVHSKSSSGKPCV